MMVPYNILLSFFCVCSPPVYRLLSVNDDGLILKALFIIIADIIFGYKDRLYNNGDKICHRKRIIKNKTQRNCRDYNNSRTKNNNSPFRKLISDLTLPYYIRTEFIFRFIITDQPVKPKTY